LIITIPFVLDLLFRLLSNHNKFFRNYRFRVIIDFYGCTSGQKVVHFIKNID